MKATTTLRQPAELIAHGLAPADALAELEKVAARYAVAVTPAVAELIDITDPDDPIARQYIPSTEELLAQPNENADPIGDHTHSPVDGIVHRYPDRVLFKLVHVCDPLMLSPRRLAEIMADLAAIDHVKIIRLHTRVPVADPARVSPEMVVALKVPGAATWVALHANHPRELTPAARAACARMVDAGIPLVSQSVLLRGVNDSAGTLEALMRAFVECRIKPYYLHHGDLAPGTAHLRTTIAQGQALMRSLRGNVSGLCQPDYVLDIPGGFGKAPVGPEYLSANADAAHEAAAESRYRVVDYCGDAHLYPPEA